MENRFGFRDLVFTVLLAVFIVSIWFSMKQADRHGEILRSIDKKLDSQTRDLARLENLLQSGAIVAGNPTNTPANPEQIDALQRVRDAHKADDFAQGDYYVDVFSVVPDRLTPLVSTDVYATMIQSYVLESLADRDPDTLEWMPLLATSWEIQDNADAWQAWMDEQTQAGKSEEQIEADPARPSPVIITFTLRPNARFSDGTPLTADDVVFTFDWMMNPEVEAPRQRAYYEKIERVEKVGDRQVRFVFKEPYFQALELAAGMEILPKHFYGKFEPTEFNRSTGLLLGSGPYQIADPESWRPEPGKPIELVRNDRYWGGQIMPFNKLIWRVISEDAPRLTAFRNGETDAFYPQPEQYQDMLKDEQLIARTQHFEFQRPNAGYAFFAWNQQRGGKPTLFTDKRVRQAMTLLTDRKRIIEEIYLGYGQVVTGPFSPLTQQSDKSVEPWPFDTSRAKALLAEAGYEDRDGDGVLESADGQMLRFELTYPANSDTYARLVLFVKDTFARAGVVVDPRPVEWSVLLQRIDSRDFDAISLGWSGSIEGDPYQIFHSSQMGDIGDNFISYKNEALDKLIEQARATVQEDERMPLWHEVHQILHEDQPYTFLFARKTLAFFDGRFKNIRRTAVGLTPVMEWYVPADEQKFEK